MLVEHVLKLPLGLAFESDEFHAVSIGLLPPDNSKRDDDRSPGPGEFDMQAEMRADGKLDVTLDLAAANG